VLIAVDPLKYYEQSYSLMQYLMIEKNINIFGYAVTGNYNDKVSSGLINGWKYYFTDRQMENMNDLPDLIIFLNKQEVENFYKSSGLQMSDYDNILPNEFRFPLFRRKYPV
jgi:hypothetical protein